MRQTIRDLTHVVGIAPAVKTTTTLSSACDLAGYEGCIARFHCGAFGDAQSGSVYIEAELQDSDDNASYAAVADALVDFPTAFSTRTGHATGTFFQSKTDAAADTAGLYTVGYHGQKRYLKVNVRVTGSNSTGTIVGVVFDRLLPAARPVQ